MSAPVILAAMPSDAKIIARNLRKQSVKEVERVGGAKVEQIEAAIKRAQYSWTGWVDGEIACIWGIETVTIMADEATLWMISTPLVEKHAFTFVRKSQIFIRELMKQRFKLIHGMVSADFERSIAWLKWLGFKINAAQNGMCYFHMNRV